MELTRLLLPLALPCLVAAFEVVWGVPSKKCLRINASLPLRDYGIKQNPDETLVGPEIVLFYERDLGLYPFIDKEGKFVNGGIPQQVDLEAHLKKVVETVKQRVPDPGFSGLGVIDWEAWRPVWNSNYGTMRKYQKASLAEARKRWPKATLRELKVKARRRFNKAAKQLMTETVLLVRSLRPWGKWGFYGFPMCFHQDTKARTCSRNSHKYNGRWSWIYKVSTGLFPSVYLLNKHLKEKWSQERKLLYIQIGVKEALQWAGIERGADPVPVFAFTKFSYDPYHDLGLFYSKADLCASVKQVADMGAAGIVLWSSYFAVRSEAGCRRTMEAVADLVGPYVLIVKEQQRQCRKAQCSGRGRCYLPAPWPLECSSVTAFSAYSCQCLPGRSGKHCGKAALSSFWRMDPQRWSAPGPLVRR